MVTDSIDVVVDALRRGEVVGLPTDTVYGLGIAPGIPGTSERLFSLKERPVATALPVLVADLEQGEALATGPLARFGQAFWPGPLTIVVPRSPDVDWDLGGDPATIGLRCPAHEMLRTLLTNVGPLAVSSGNRHGGAPCTTANELEELFGDELAVVLDGGRCDAQPSTVISLVGGSLTVLREGPIDNDALVRVAKQALFS